MLNGSRKNLTDPPKKKKKGIPTTSTAPTKPKIPTTSTAPTKPKIPSSSTAEKKKSKLPVR